MEVSLREYGITPNGVIHVGADKGQMAKYWHSEGVYQVLWVEKKQSKYAELYRNASPFGMHQLYYIQELSSEDYADPFAPCRFKTLWRRNAVDIDIETYDLLYINAKEEISKIIEGFGDFINYMKHIILHPSLSQTLAEKALLEMGYGIALETDMHVIYEAR